MLFPQLSPMQTERACSYHLRCHFFNEIWQFLLFNHWVLCLLFLPRYFARTHACGGHKLHEHSKFVYFSGTLATMLASVCKQDWYCLQKFSISFSSQACLCMFFPMKNRLSMLMSNVLVNCKLHDLARKFLKSFSACVEEKIRVYLCIK